MITTFYAAPLALLIVWLSLRVIGLRRSRRVALGDGDDPDLRAAIRAQGNATEYVPLALILLLLLEIGGGHLLLVHAAGVALVAGRAVHARGLLTCSLRLRVLGMQLTLFTLIGLAVAGFGYALAALLPAA